MVEASKRVFLVAGVNFFQRQQAIAALKKRLLKNKPASLNILTFYSKEIDVNVLAQKIITFSFDKEKVIIFKDAYSLPQSVKEFLLENYQKIISSNFIILDMDRDFFQLQKDKKISGDKFFNRIFKEAVSFKASSLQQEVSIDDFKKSVRERNLNSSLYFLEKLCEKNNSKELGPLILGILVREVSYFNNLADKEKTFSYLWETDRAIKEKGIDTKLAIELLLSKLLLKDS